MAKLTFLSLVLILAGAPAAQICGDCDTDGDVDIVDALTGAQHAVGLQMLMGVALNNCDVNLDMRVDVVDALFIAQSATGLPAPLCGMGGGGGAAGTCGDPIMLNSGTPFMGTTTDGMDQTWADCESSFIFNREKVHEITFSGTRTLQVTITTTFQSAANVRTSCLTPATEIDCDSTGSSHNFTLPGLSGGTYFIIVDGRTGVMSGEGSYTVTATVM